ncbi:MAG: hypothetical protein IT303_13390 [Dehalococcoidia bacterium]|nr:hypothetical protein [Dehalococcoidia bacterium]
MTHPNDDHPHGADGDHLHQEHWTQGNSTRAVPGGNPGQFAEFATDQPASRSRQAHEDPALQEDAVEHPAVAKGVMPPAESPRRD